jgi:hypothetical protein
MDALQHWTTIREIVDLTLKTTNFCALATVNPDGSPHVAPIGSLVLQEGGKGYFFEKFPRTTRNNLEQHQRVCVLAAPRGFWPFMKALFQGRFADAPGVRLLGRAGVRRAATAEEMRRWQDRVKHFRLFRNLKGYKLLWDDMRYVREITFDSFEPLHLGTMTQGLWQDPSIPSQGSTME